MTLWFALFIGGRIRLERELGRRFSPARPDVGVPGHAGLRAVIGGMSRRRRNPDQVVAIRALDLPPGKLFLNLKVLITVRTIELEFTHGGWWVTGDRWNEVQALAVRFSTFGAPR